MKNQAGVSEHMKITYDRVKPVLSVIFIGLFSLVYLFWFYHLGSVDFNIPFVYSGDALGFYVTAKQIAETGWFFSDPNLGAPLTQNYLFSTGGTLFDLNYFAVWVFNILFAGNWVKAVNVYFLSLFFINSVSAYYVLKKLDVQNTIATFFGLSFGFSYFVFIRNIIHLCLAACFTVPLAILLCFWIAYDEDFLAFGSGFWNKKTILTILFCLLLATSFPYFPFFGCMFFLISGLSVMLKGKGLHGLISAVKCVAITGGFFVLNKSVLIIRTLTGAADGGVIERTYLSEEHYGLKIFSLLFPPNGFYSESLQTVKMIYDAGGVGNGENMDYIGLVGVIGFLLLTVCLFLKPGDSPLFDRLKLLSEMNITAILLGTIGGFSTVIGFFVTRYIRCYNRLSFFISFIGILALALVLTAFYESTVGKKRIQRLTLCFTAVLSLLCIYTNSTYMDLSVSAETWKNDEAFIKTIEEKASEGAMIYQLPNVNYPENGPLYGMPDYEHYRARLHSDKLHWSYGAYTGTEAAEINERISECTVPEMVNALSQEGYDGIYVDVRGYDTSKGELILRELEDTLGEALVSNNNEQFFFVLKGDRK